MFFHFSQNNSGGSFDAPYEDIIIEANNYKQANALAKDEGVYFDGVEDGYDCACCGDRWSAQWSDSDGTKSPEIYGKHPSGHKTFDKKMKILVVYLDGRREEFGGQNV